jgi:hypothetical protein
MPDGCVHALPAPKKIQAKIQAAAAKAENGD